MKLFIVTTTAKQHRGCKDVVFSWFRTEKPSEWRPYGELIENYEPGNRYAEWAIDELFSEDEALLLKEYLDRTYADAGVTVIKEQSLPIPNNVMVFGAMAVGGEDGFCMLDKDPEYSLPFKVWGYYDLVGCELVDGSDVYHRRLWMVSANGEVRQQTNEEAAAMARAMAAVERGLMTAEDFRQQWVAGRKEGRLRDD
jgi:hypothetical protein